MAAVGLSFHQYKRFFLVGTGVGLLAIAFRELIAAALPADTPLFYSISVVVVYGFGILGVLLRYALDGVHVWRWKQLVRKELLSPVKS